MLKYYYILALTKLNYQLEGIIRIKKRFANTYPAHRFKSGLKAVYKRDVNCHFC